MRTVGLRRGCLDPVTCGAQSAHTCGGVDACPAVKASGVVCTFGTYSAVPVFTQADIDALAADLSGGILPVDPFQLTFAKNMAKRLMSVGEGNMDTPENEAAHLAGANKLFTDNKALHDSKPEVFGHSVLGVN